MNIFYLDGNPKVAANYLCDKHLTKMALEGIQLLNNNSDVKLIKANGEPFKPTHTHHPCSLWVGRSPHNYDWLWNHVYEILNIRPSKIMINYLMKLSETNLNGQWQLHSPPALCMPDYCKVGPTAVDSYRAYYLTKPFVGKNSYKGRAVPSWVQSE